MPGIFINGLESNLTGVEKHDWCPLDGSFRQFYLKWSLNAGKSDREMASAWGLSH
jgi:hypothetical protein